MKIESKEDGTMTKSDANLERENISKSRLKPPSTRIIGGGSKKFVVQSLKSSSRSSYNGIPSQEAGSSAELRTVKPLTAQSDSMTKQPTSAVENAGTQTVAELRKAKMISQPRSALKTSREPNSSVPDGKEKKKCVTILDVQDKSKKHSSWYNLNEIPPAENAAPQRVRRSSEGSNNTQYNGSTELASDAMPKGKESGETSTDNAETTNNAVETHSQVPELSVSDNKEALPDQDVSLSGSATKQSTAVTPESIPNGASTEVHVDSHNNNIPSVKEPDVQSQNVSVELSKKPSAAVVEPSADTEKTEEDEDEASHTKSPDGRYIRQNEEIGRGSFKTVFKGLDVETGVAIAWCELMVSFTRLKENLQILS